MARIAGFWSYVRDDDENDGGRILRLAERVAEEFQMMTGEDLELFVDRDLRWGEEWEKRISHELQETTYLIPVVTPSYFRHKECRKELLRFAGEASSLGVEQLLLPIYYVSVPELERDEPSSDEAMSLIEKTKWEDLRDVRLLDEGDAEHRRLINKLAKRLYQIATQTEGEESFIAPVGRGVAPEIPETLPSPPSVDREGPEDGKAEGGTDGEEGFGLLDLMARAESVMPQWTETITQLGAQIKEVGELTTASTHEMEAMDERGQGNFASRLAAANRLAAQLDEPAENMVRLGQEYASHLVAVDPGVLTILRLAEEQENADELEEFIDGLRHMIDASGEGAQYTTELVKSLEDNAGFSRELRRPLSKMTGALRNILDGQSIVDEWDRRLSSLEEKRTS